ncbi:hypothetical protein, partial [Caballeronia sp. ATUFL_F1_KS4A]|uniref:hypothetical protein n=1 Tax=Caballeronia sp. ATUFL_F1_KS4A TaxID=2921768 RepID=UPI002541B7E4
MNRRLAGMCMMGSSFDVIEQRLRCIRRGGFEAKLRRRFRLPAQRGEIGFIEPAPCTFGKRARQS